MHTTYLLCSAADAVCSGNWPIFFKVTLNVTMCTVHLHLSKLHLGLSFVADFSNTGTRAECTHCFPA